MSKDKQRREPKKPKKTKQAAPSKPTLIRMPAKETPPETK